jgi:hypothetical protein
MTFRASFRLRAFFEARGSSTLLPCAQRILAEQDGVKGFTIHYRHPSLHGRSLRQAQPAANDIAALQKNNTPTAQKRKLLYHCIQKSSITQSKQRQRCSSMVWLHGEHF